MMTPTTSSSAPLGGDLIGRLVGPIFSRETWSATGFLLGSLFVGASWFTAAIALLVTGASTLIIVVGVPILIGLAGALRAMARSERGRLRAAGATIDEPVDDRQTPVSGNWARLQAELGDPGTYRRLLYAVLMLPIGVVSFTIAAVTWLVPLSFVITPFLVAVGIEPTASSEAGDWEIAIDTLTKANGIAVAGLLLMPVAPRVIRAAVRWYARLAGGLLGGAGPVAAPVDSGVEMAR